MYAANNPLINFDPDGRSIWTKIVKVAVKVGNALVKGGNVASEVAGVFDDVQTLDDPNASTMDKVIAGVSLASELLPVSVGDVKEAKNAVEGIVSAASDAKKVENAADGAKSERWINAEKKLETAAKGEKSSRAEFIVTPNGTSVPLNQNRMREGFDRSGFPTKPVTQTVEKGVIHTVPTKNGKVDVRTMEGGKHHPKRAVITHPSSNSPKTPDGKATRNKNDNHILQH